MSFKCRCQSGVENVELEMQLADVLSAGRRWPCFLLQNARAARASKIAAGGRLIERPSAVRRARVSTEHEALRGVLDAGAAIERAIRRFFPTQGLTLRPEIVGVLSLSE